MLRRASKSNQSQSVCISIKTPKNQQVTNVFQTTELDEEGTRISLTIVDTPGFGDQIDNEARLDFIFRFAELSVLTVQAFRRSLDISSDNMTIFLLKSPESSVIRVSGITVSTSSSTSSPRQVMGLYYSFLCFWIVG
jgi:hypothetical protein